MTGAGLSAFGGVCGAVMRVVGFLAVRGRSGELVELEDGLSGNILPIFETTLPRLELPPPAVFSLSFPDAESRPAPLDLSGLEIGLELRRGFSAAANRPTGEGVRLCSPSMGASNSRATDTCEVSVVATALDSLGNVEALIVDPSNCTTGLLLGAARVARTKGLVVVRNPRCEGCDERGGGDATALSMKLEQ